VLAAVAVSIPLAASAEPVAPPGGAAPAAAPQAPAATPAPDSPMAVRASAVESEIRTLERHLAALRRTRGDLKDGREDVVPVDEKARRARDLDTRCLREATRYEGSRAKAVAALIDATDAKDEAKAALARTALEAADRKFVDAMKRLDEERAAAKESAKAAEKDPPAEKPVEKPAARPRPTKSSDADDMDD
jgi:hypothetical protein